MTVRVQGSDDPLDYELFLAPFRSGIGCLAHATFLHALINDDSGNLMEIPDAICIL